MVANVQEAHSRDAPVIALVSAGENPFDAGCATHGRGVDRSRTGLADGERRALQLFAYHVAVARGCDVDQPATSPSRSPWSSGGVTAMLVGIDVA